MAGKEGNWKKDGKVESSEKQESAESIKVQKEGKCRKVVSMKINKL